VSVPLAALAVVLLAFGVLGDDERAQACRASQFKVSFGPDLPSPTGRHDVVIRLRNDGPSCRLQGYPSVVLLDRRGNVLPFLFRRGGGMTVTSGRPKPMRLRRGGSAWIVLEKYRCDLGGGRVAPTARVALPGAEGRIRLRFPPAGGFDYCGRGDPGSTIFVSPVAPTLRAALASYGPRG
jgi:hypothetical protein